MKIEIFKHIAVSQITKNRFENIRKGSRHRLTQDDLLNILMDNLMGRTAEDNLLDEDYEDWQRRNK